MLDNQDLLKCIVELTNHFKSETPELNDEDLMRKIKEAADMPNANRSVDVVPVVTKAYENVFGKVPEKTVCDPSKNYKALWCKLNAPRAYKNEDITTIVNDLGNSFDSYMQKFTYPNLNTVQDAIDLFYIKSYPNAYRVIEDDAVYLVTDNMQESIDKIERFFTNINFQVPGNSIKVEKDGDSLSVIPDGDDHLPLYIYAVAEVGGKVDLSEESGVYVKTISFNIGA